MEEPKGPSHLAQPPGLQAPGIHVPQPSGLLSHERRSNSAESSGLLGPARLSVKEVGLIFLGLSACWVAAGSVALLASPLRHALLALLLGGLVVWVWPGRWVWIIGHPSGQNPGKPGSVRSTPPARPAFFQEEQDSAQPPKVPITPERLAQAGTVLVGVILFGADSHPVVNLLAVVLAMAGLASLHQDRLKKILTSLALAGLVLAAHRLGVLSVPLYWHLVNRIGSLLGWIGGSLAGQPLEVGETFGGVDFLVLSFAWGLLWGKRAGSWSWKLALGVCMALLGGHLLYLGGLSWAPILRDKLPPPPPRPEFHVYLPPPWSWSDALKTLLPWGFPWVGMAIHLIILGLAARWIGWSICYPQLEGEGAKEPASSFPSKEGNYFPQSPLKEIALEAGPVLLAILWGFIMFFWGVPGNLAGKKILAYTPRPEEWSWPRADRYARSEMGRFGMLPELVARLGGRWTPSTQLAKEDLAQADVVLLLGDVGPFPQAVADCLQEYVKHGGSVLVASSGAKNADVSGSGQIFLQELLADWGINFRYETGVPVWGDWADGLLLGSHPALLPLAQAHHLLRKSLVGWERAGSLEVYPPASPLLVGCWGYGDPGREAVQADFLPRYDAGERLGDVVLAAETRLGSGRVVVLASPECLQTGNLPISYVFVGRLLGYLAHRGGSPADLWRQIVGLVCGGLMVVLLAYRPHCPALTVTAAVVGLMLLAGWWRTTEVGRVVPQPTVGSPITPAASWPTPVSRTGPPGAAFSPGVAHASPRGGVSSEDTSSQGARLGTEPVEKPLANAPKGLPLAYIDASHMEAYSLRPWHPDGLGRLFLSLMQAGYLPLLAPDMKPDRLRTASVWISIAPARSFSRSEQAAFQEYVQNGGIFIAMAGAEDAEALRPLLQQWGLWIPRSPVGPGQTEPEAEPVGQSPGPEDHPDNYGRLRTYYLNAKDYGRGDYMLAVTLYAPWPVQTDTPEMDAPFTSKSAAPIGEAEVLVRGYHDVPIVIHRRIGGGSVVLIGDTYFATNKNFDETDGQPTAGMIENAHFWRWMLSRVSGPQEWIPPDPKQWQNQLPPEELLPEESDSAESPRPIRP